MSIRIAVGQFNELTEEKLRFAAQIGATGIQMNKPKLPGDERWEEEDLRAAGRADRGARPRLRGDRERAGALLRQGRCWACRAATSRSRTTATRSAPSARAGIPVLGYHFMPNSVWRTERLAPGRGGAGCTAVRHGSWSRPSATPRTLRQFLPTTLGRQERDAGLRPGRGGDRRRGRCGRTTTTSSSAVLPVAEEAGVSLALHPDDPPVPMLGGVARLFHEPAGFKRA